METKTAGIATGASAGTRRQVIKRDGRTQDVHFDKITARIQKLCYGLDMDFIDPVYIAQKVIGGIYPGVTTVELDTLGAETAVALTTTHSDYGILAARIAVSNLHKQTEKSFSRTIARMHAYVNPRTGKPAAMVSDALATVVARHAEVLDAAVNHSLDDKFTFFGFKTLEHAYLRRIDNEVCERPQHMYMRVAVGIHTTSFETTNKRARRDDDDKGKERTKSEKDNAGQEDEAVLQSLDVRDDKKCLPPRFATEYELDIDACLETYKMLSEGWFTHATPTLTGAGTPRNQLASCFLLTMSDDSIEGIYDTLKQCALISKSAGGIGLAVHNIRASGSYIAGTNGNSNGLVPMLRVFASTARYVDQGGNKRPGAFSCFAANTEVMTVNAGVKHIQDVQIGDLVVTHLNRVRPVMQVHKNPLGDRKLYKVKVEKSKEVIVTGNHKFWSSWTKKYKNTMVAQGWHSVEELKALMDTPATKRQACYISIPSGTGIPEKSAYDQLDLKEFSESILNGIDALEDVPGGKIVPLTFYTDQHGNARSNRGQEVNRFWTVNEDLVNLFGMWLGDGCIRKSKGKINGISFTVHKDNLPEIEFIKRTCQIAFGCTVTTFTTQSDDKNVTSVDVNSHIVGAVFMALFGSYFDGKRLPNMVFGWHLKLVNHFMAGLITTDGHIAKEKHTATLALSNLPLINQLYHLCRNNGVDVSFPVKGNRSEGMTCDSYSMSIPLSRDILDNIYKLYHDGRVKECFDTLAIKDRNNNDKFLKVLDIAEIDRTDEWVYTLGVAEDHSYTVEGGLLAENCYLEPWHADIFEFLELKKNTGAEEMRARDLFYALWVPDLFMERVEANGKWTLMCPHQCPGLSDCYDAPDNKAFTQLYEKYEREGKGIKTIDAQKLWFAILEAQTESGTPYMLYKDECNSKSNQKNLGTIKCSNLCTEIVQYSSPDEIATCNLASIALPTCVVIAGDEKPGGDKPRFDFAKLHKIVKVATRNLNKLIDINGYPLLETRRSNMRHRPIGIGVQGLADTFVLLRLPFVSDGAMELNKRIFETMYHAALEASVELAKRYGPYDSYEGSPVSQGILQFDMWPETKGNVDDSLWNWTALRAEIRKHGVRNSLLIAPMPTASTSQILGNNEACEPFTSNIYTRRVLSGEYKMVNKYMQQDLIKLGLWNETMRNQIIANRGSIANIDGISPELKELYKTVWEIPQKKLVDMAADRGAFIDQSQSFNVFIAEPTFAKLTSLHFYTWRKGLKTGMYYLRSRPAADPIQFTVDQASLGKTTRGAADEARAANEAEKVLSMQCSLQNKDACTACSS